MTSSSIACTAVSLLLLAGCAVAPTGPSIMALPGSGKNFEQFRNDDSACRQYAQQQSGGASADRAAADAGMRSAAAGTLVGAVAGAAIGGRDAAGVGAGTGLIVGSMAGTGAAQSTAHSTQRNYDNAYVQCMYAKGQQVPVPASAARNRTPAAPPVDRAPATAYPPPPPGYAPSPPGYAPPPAAYPPPDYPPPPAPR